MKLNSLVMGLLPRCGGPNIRMPLPRSALHFWCEEFLMSVNFVDFRKMQCEREPSEGDLCGEIDFKDFNPF